MPLMFQEVKTKVGQRIKLRTINSIVNYVTDKDPTLWGLEQPRGFLKKSCYVALFKDLYSVGYIIW